MKKLFVVLCILCMFSWGQIVYAETMPSDGFKISVNAQTGSANSTLSMKLTKDNKVISAESGVSYYVKFLKNQDDPAPYRSSVGCNGYDDIAASTTLGGFNAVSSDGTISIDDDWYISNGFEYAYIVKYEKSGPDKICTVSSEPIHVAKPNLPSLNKRYKVYVSDAASRGFDDGELEGCPNYGSTPGDRNDSLAICPLFPYVGTYGQHSITHTYALVNDASIIEKIKNHESDAYDKLLAYARNVRFRDDPEARERFEPYNGYSWATGDHKFNSIGPFTSSYSTRPVEGTYYVLYTTYEESVDIGDYYSDVEEEYYTRDLYRSLEGVNLLQIKNGRFISIFDWDKTSDSSSSIASVPSVTTKPTSTPSVTSTPSITVAPKVTNPKTGTVSLIVIGIVLMVSFMGGLYYYRLLKNNNV